MIIVAYDFRNDKKRAKFAKFLSKYGYRIQYSVFKLDNSKRVLKNVIEEVEHKYKKHFNYSDNILIFQVCEGCEKKIKRYGFAANEEMDIVFMG